MSFKDLGVATDILVMAIILIVIILFLGISVFLILIHVCVVGRAFGAGVGNDIVIERESTGTASMSLDDLEKLPCYDYVAKGKENSVNCAVCLDNLEDGDKCRMLPLCKHSFHAKCVDAWLLKTPICPICRTSANSSRRALIISEENGQFSDTSTEIRESRTTESSQFFSDASTSLELREGLPTASCHLVSNIRPHVRESPTSDIIMELGQNEEENNQLSFAGIESTQIQLATVPALDPASELPV